MTRLTFAQVSEEFQSMGYELRKETKGYSCEVSNKFQNLQAAKDWLSEQVSIATGNTENYLDSSDENPTFEQVATAIAHHGYELHRNNGQFFTESKAPYVYFKTGQSEYALHVTYFLDTIEQSVMENVAFDVNNQRYQQIAFELYDMGDKCPDEFPYTTLSQRVRNLEQRLINAVEQRKSNVRGICNDIGKMVKEWSSGQGFGNTVKRVTRKVARHAKRFYTMLTERIAPKYTVQ